MPRERGTYAIGLAVAAPTRCAVGALGAHVLPSGTYVYVGSAWGTGGLRARVSRHLVGSPSARWHIDYLRRVATPIAYWLARGVHLECAWAQSLLGCPGLGVIVPGFGASDCGCNAHLVYGAEVDLAALPLSGGVLHSLAPGSD